MTIFGIIALTVLGVILLIGVIRGIVKCIRARRNDEIYEIVDFFMDMLFVDLLFDWHLIDLSDTDDFEV